MACDVLKCLIFSAYFLVLSLYLHPVFCDEYLKHFLENNELCSYALKKKIFLLSSKDKSALLVSQRQYFKNWSGKSAFTCDFHVHTNNQGLFAVIQDLSFRRNQTTGECIDYIQFRQAENFPISINIHFDKDLLHWGPKYCGQMKATDIKIEDPETDVAPNAYIDDKGATDVRVHIAKKKLFDNETLDMEIVFTAFQPCRFDNNYLKNCGENMCIWQKFFNDGKVNCPFIDCKDEGTCVLNINGTRITKYPNGLGVRLSMNAIASVFSVFLVFISCLWLCRHCGAFCFEPSSQPIILASPVEMADVHMQPTATAPPIADDKDLPPSYDSLFPEER